MELGKFGVWVSFDGVEMSVAVEASQRIESLGYSTLWHSMSVRRDLMLVASTLLSETESLHVATGILPLFERTPGVLAAGQAFLNAQSNGRFLLGVGVSHSPIVSGMHGETYGSPIRTMRSYLDRMDRGLDFSELLGLPKSPDQEAEPPTQTGPPRVLGALGPKMIGLARDRAQGAHTYFMPPEHTHAAREILGPDAWLCPEVKVILETDADRARAAAREAGSTNIRLENYQRAWRRYGFEDADFADGGSNRLIDATVAWGSETKIETFLRSHLEAGADQIAINFVNPDGGGAGLHWEALETFAPNSAG